MRGYIEGYYGRILSWQDRHRIINQLATLGMSSYLYAVSYTHLTLPTTPYV